MNSKWVLRNECDRAEIESLALELNVIPVIAQLLLNRGIRNFDLARHFFRADLENLHDPFLISGMEIAVERVISAINNNQKIMVYGDYDVDGVTSIALMLQVFRKELNYPITYYVPNRLQEGYGLSATGIEHAAQTGVHLIISVDCGVTAHEEIALARDLGMDVIVVDHHEAGDTLPNALAILDPKRANDTYPFKELAGVGVTYKFLQALFGKLGHDLNCLAPYIELVALGTAADIVPLIDENRIFVRRGLRTFHQSTNIGLQALLRAAALQNRPLNTGHIVFMVAPRINAVGRLGNAARAVKLLTTDDTQQAKQIAAVLESENRKRKAIDEHTFEEALARIEAEYQAETEYAFILEKEGWHPGVIGIVASRVVEKHYRPTILIAVENGIGKGSARSIPGFDLYQALKACDGFLTGFGGHKYAAGLTIESDKIDLFRQHFTEVAKQMLDDDKLTPKLNIDTEIHLSQIDPKFYRILKQFGPFGPQNMRPIFVARNLEIVGTPSIVGKNHLRFKVRQHSKVMDAIGFNLGHLSYRLAPGEKNLDLAFTIDENEWMGTTTIQLRVKDLI